MALSFYWVLILKNIIAFCKKGERVLANIEDAALVVLLLSTVLIACAQIILRNGFSSGISWADPALKMLVLYLTVFGSLVAARENKHLSIDVLSKFLPEKLNLSVQKFTNTCAAIVCFLMAFYSVKLVQLSLEFGDIAFNDIPMWILQLIMPIGFFLMGLRFVFNIFSREISPDATFGLPLAEHATGEKV